MPKHRYFLEIAYNGSAFHGWQIQPNSLSVQQVMNECISTMLSHSVNCMGCGRTDAGVHARCFFLHFDTEKELDADFSFRLNAFLPKEIKILHFYKNPEKIHARWDAISRSYEYLVAKGKNPFLSGLAATIYEILDIAKMNEACKTLSKYNDFKTFSKGHNQHEHYLCDLLEAYWSETEELYIFRITANRFVRSMVRMITGTMVEIGKGKISLDEFRSIIESKDRSRSGMAMPACGLYLTQVVYPQGKLLLIK